MADITGYDKGRAPENSLVQTDGGTRPCDSAPAQVVIGVVRLAGWQVHRLESPASFSTQDSYLIKLNYDLVLEPEMPAPSWFEVAFGLSVAGRDGPVAVLDALPRAVFESYGPAAYGVSDYLNFSTLPGLGSATVDLPALRPFIDAFGVGGSQISWRYMAPGPDAGIQGVRPGAYVSWIIVLVPAGCAKLDVQLTVRYGLATDDALGCPQGTQPRRFFLALAADRQASSTVQSLPDLSNWAHYSGPRGASAERSVRVFIAYAHDDEHHVESVRAFAEFLALCGLDVRLDQWALEERRDWYQWAGEQLRLADYVIIVASPMCRRVADGEVEKTRHLGLQSEMGQIRELLHSDRAAWTRKLLPVVLPGGSVSGIPLFLQPWTADHYQVKELTVPGAEDLIRVVTRQAPYQRHAASPLLVLPPRLTAQGDIH
jgi:hypothetical protein